MLDNDRPLVARRSGQSLQTRGGNGKPVDVERPTSILSGDEPAIGRVY
jgi:hypothetical protein